MSQTTTDHAHPVLIAGDWRPATGTKAFQAFNPATGETLPDRYPVSNWDDIDAALTAADSAFALLQAIPRAKLSEFLNRYADLIEANTGPLVAAAHLETALPVLPRLQVGELPRTTSQLRQAAKACTDPSWRMPTVDAAGNIRSVLEPLGPVLVIGPNNFPFAFNGISGGDFAAAIAAGCPVIAKAHHLHPTTSRLLAEVAQQAACDLPAGTVQMLYAMDNDDGLKMAADARLGAVAFTGSREAGLSFKKAADEVGKPVFVELSAVNPVVVLPGALRERLKPIVDETVTSALMGGGQFCTNPGLIITVADSVTDEFAQALADRYGSSPPATLFGSTGARGLDRSVKYLQSAGAALICGGGPTEGAGFQYRNTLLRVEGTDFLKSADALQTEAFGNATLLVVCQSISEVASLLGALEGSLTGSIYSALDGSEDDTYDQLAPILARRVGRLINDKMPTGVAVSPAMNHGGPFPATGHPHFTAVGMPAACRRFTRLMCYDNVRLQRLPELLR